MLRRFEELVEAVSSLPPPAAPASDPNWRRLFRWCDEHRVVLAERARMRNKLPRPDRVDVWLRELASPPNKTWDSVRYNAMSFIRLVGIPPRSSGEPMFSHVSKINSQHSSISPLHYPVLFMERDMEEILDSQGSMLTRLGKPTQPGADIAKAYRQQVRHAKTWLTGRGIPALTVSNADLVHRPDEGLPPVAAFLGVPHE